jgi:hypothetical protein
MKLEIMYNENAQLWKMGELLTSAGYRKTEDCYWLQIYENSDGDSVVAQREDTSVCIADPVDRLARYLNTGAKSPARALDIAAANIKARRDRSAWDKGVNAYALELVDSIAERAEYEKHHPETVDELADYALNGARDWGQYSWGGSALVYDCDIAERLCCPSELRRVKGGERRPNAREEWLDVQVRALHQAYARIKHAWREYMEG